MTDDLLPDVTDKRIPKSLAWSAQKVFTQKKMFACSSRNRTSVQRVKRTKNLTISTRNFRTKNRSIIGRFFEKQFYRTRR